jgi:tetratricopeptide (TPR) repeat protein
MTDIQTNAHSLAPLSNLIAHAKQEYQDAGSQRWRQPAPGEMAGDLINRYQLLEKIGEGGMGTVWRAQQIEPVKRIVALKIIKLGMDTKEVIARFDAERQALAMMDHAHIAKVFDGGSTERGRPYFVMELVEGVAVTEYCEDEQLSVPERLALFMRACEAIQHAHQKGIIHRDIKPSNVLVTMRDGAPVVKVIDFGIAKATSVELTQKTLFTKYAQIIGTPEYMAPEQAEQEEGGIDTRADVYSLGVLLYELLTGCLPFDLRAVLRSGYTELLRTIREVEPVRPSTRVSGHRESSETTTSRALQALAKQLRGDLDWVVLKALEKDRTRRYETALGLAEDVQRFLEQEPVLAAPPSAGYRMRKFVQRRKAAVIAAAAITLLVIMGSIGTGVGWWRAAQVNQDLDVALQEKSELLISERSERERAITAEQEASLRSAELEQVANFQAQQLGRLNIADMGDRLQQSLLGAALVEGREALDEGLEGVNFSDISLQLLEESLFNQSLESIDEQFEDQPLVQAQLLQSVGESMTRLGLHGAAMDPHTRALALRRQWQGDDHASTVNLLHLIGVALLNQRRIDEAEPYIREALERTEGVLDEDDPVVLLSLNNLGGVLFSQGKLAEAEPFYERALAGRRRTLGPDHRSTLRSTSTMGSLLMLQGKLPESEAFFLKAYEGQERAFGEQHMDTLKSAALLGTVLMQQSKLAEAEPWLRKSVEGNSRIFGDLNEFVLNSKRNLGRTLRGLGRLAEAEGYLQQTLNGFTAIERLQTGDAKEAMVEMDLILRDQISVERAGQDPVKLRGQLAKLGALLLLSGEAVEAELVLSEAASMRQNGSPAADWRLAVILGDLGFAFASQGHHGLAATHLTESLEALLANDSALSGERAQFNIQIPIGFQRIADNYDTWHELQPSASYDQEAATWRERSVGWSKPETGSTDQ